jgi:hypothetical protein
VSVNIGRVNPAYTPTATKAELGGGRLKLDGQIASDDALVLQAASAQIIALSSDVDNPAIPVTFDGSLAGMADLNGFYRVTDSSVSIPQGGHDPTFEVGYWPWSVSLVPVPDRHAPRIESILDSVFRTESTTMVAADSDAWHAVPDSIAGYDDGSGQDLVCSFDWMTDTGSILYGTDTTNTPPYRRVTTWRCKPEDWYQGAATVERLWDATWLPVIGRTIGLADPAGSEWGISNGLIRFRWTGTGGQWRLECFDGTVWESLTAVGFLVYSSPAFSPLALVEPISVAVIRNNPCEVRIRITGTTHNWSPPSVVDLRLRRGSSIMEVYWAVPNSTVGLGYPGEILFDPGVTWTTPTNAGRHGNADANGHIVVQLTPEGTSNTADTAWRTAFGFAISGAPTNYTALRNNYYAPSAEHVRIVGA